MNGFILAGRYLSEIPALGKLKWEDFPVQGQPGIQSEVLYQTQPRDLILLSVCKCFLPGDVCVPHVCLVPGDVNKSIGAPGTGVEDGCELSCGFMS